MLILVENSWSFRLTIIINDRFCDSIIRVPHMSFTFTWVLILGWKFFNRWIQCLAHNLYNQTVLAHNWDQFTFHHDLIWFYLFILPVLRAFLSESRQSEVHHESKWGIFFSYVWICFVSQFLLLHFQQRNTHFDLTLQNHSFFLHCISSLVLISFIPQTKLMGLSCHLTIYEKSFPPTKSNSNN